MSRDSLKMSRVRGVPSAASRPTCKEDYGATKPQEWVNTEGELVKLSPCAPEVPDVFLSLLRYGSFNIWLLDRGGWVAILRGRPREPHGQGGSLVAGDGRQYLARLDDRTGDSLALGQALKWCGGSCRTRAGRGGWLMGPQRNGRVSRPQTEGAVHGK